MIIKKDIPLKGTFNQSGLRSAFLELKTLP